MEVTRTNLEELLPEIETAISKATFLSIDCEMTGLNMGYDINAFDTQKQYYAKLYRGSKDFLVIQYGLAIFRYDETNEEFKQSCYNFYIFPRTFNRNIPDPRFLCQASSIDFLSSNGFDFNKLFKNGISYLNSIDETKYKEYLNEKQKARGNILTSPANSTQNYIAIPNEDKPFIDKVFKEIEEFIDSDLDEYILPKCNAFVRRLIYQDAPKKLNNRVHLKTKILENKERVLVVSRVKTEKQRQEEEKNLLETEENELQNAIGFSKVVKLIVDSGKLVIGHNMFLDLLHTVDKFLTPLPADYTDFKDCTHCLFPRILDTKFMSSSVPFRELVNSNVLSHLLNTLSQEPFQLPNAAIDEGAAGYSLKDAKEHEAGYDAYITGLAFIAMCNYLGKSEGSEKAVLPESQLLKPYVNRIFLMRLQDSPFVHLGGTDPSPSRDHVFHVSFPKEWKLNDLVQLFSPFGSVYVAWIDNRSAYVGLQKRDQAAVALSTLSQSDTYKVMTYRKRQAMIEGRAVAAPPSPVVLKTVKRISVSETPEPDTCSSSSLTSRKRRKSYSIVETIISKPIFPTIAKKADEEDIDCGEIIAELKSPVSKKSKKTFEESEWD